MSESAAQRRAAWEALIGLVGVISATQVAGDSLIETIAASALFTIGVAAFVHAGAMVLKGLRRTRRARRRDAEITAVSITACQRPLEPDTNLATAPRP